MRVAVGEVGKPLFPLPSLTGLTRCDGTAVPPSRSLLTKVLTEDGSWNAPTSQEGRCSSKAWRLSLFVAVSRTIIEKLSTPPRWEPSRPDHHRCTGDYKQEGPRNTKQRKTITLRACPTLRFSLLSSSECPFYFILGYISHVTTAGSVGDPLMCDNPSIKQSIAHTRMYTRI